MPTPVDRRSFIKGAGVAAGATVFPGAAAAHVDDAIDLDGGVQEIIVVFEDREDVDALERFDLPDGYYKFEALPYGYTRAEGEVIEEIAGLESVRWIDYNHELELHNENSRELTGAEAVHEELDVTGDGVHVALIDSGIAPHPDLVDKIEHNFKYVNPLDDKNRDTPWVDVGPAVDTDDIGHGTHVAGSICGTGELSDGQYRGMAPDVDAITSFRVDGPRGLFVNQVSALDRLLAMQRDGEVDVQLVNNSWGWSRYGDFNPTDATNYAFWQLFEEGVVPLFSAGNDADIDTLNPYARAPYVLTVAATNVGEESPYNSSNPVGYDIDDEKVVADFSSQGRPPEEEKDDGYGEDFELDYDENEGAHYDRKEALRNVQRYHADAPTEAPEVDHDYEEEFTSDVPAGAYVTGVGDEHFEDPETVEWESPPDAGFMSATITWEPRQQSIGVEIYPTDDSDNAIAGEYPANINQGTSVIEIEAPIDPERSYTFEFRGYGNVDAEATVQVEVLEDVSNVDGPFGIYRPGVGAPGHGIVSTTMPPNVLYTLMPVLYPNGRPTEPFYDNLSGTSMSCPVTSGVAALVFDAYSEKAGFYPKPIDVINILEATAEGGTDAELPSHHEANIGAGFVDARAAVELAWELGERAAERTAPGRGRENAPDEPGRGGGDPGARGREDTPAPETPPGRAGSDDPSVPRHPELWDRIELCSYDGDEE